jgi:hypothetical protein
VSVALLSTWLSAYCCGYYAARWWQTRTLRHRGARFRRPAVLWAGALGLAGVMATAAQPWLLVVAVAIAPLEAIVLWRAAQGRPRALSAGIAAACMSAAIAPVSYWVTLSGVQVTPVAAQLFVVCWLAFVGTVLHVKSTIRERSDDRYRWASIAFHSAAAAIAIWIDPIFAVAFGYLLLRAVLVPRGRWSPPLIGVVEIVGASLVLVTGVLAL